MDGRSWGTLVLVPYPRTLAVKAKGGRRSNPSESHSGRVVLSFEIGSLTRPPSFPRKRESSLHKSHSLKCVKWIPAFAGMTCGLDFP